MFSLQLAAALLNDPQVPGVNADNFPAVRERLAGLLAEVFVVEADGCALATPKVVTVDLAPEGEITGAWVYPEAKPGALALHVRFFDRVPPDAFCWVRLWDGADRVLAQKLFSRQVTKAIFAAPPEAVSETPPRIRPPP